MESKNFKQGKLWITPRSPFARRVRLAFLENQISFDEEVCDVFHPSQELLDKNPIGRVPVFCFRSGEVLIDSHLILQAFYDYHPSPLMPASPELRINTFRWMAIATGLCDKLVEFYIDSLRPKIHRDAEVADELSMVVGRSLGLLEAHLSNPGTLWLVDGELTQADLDVGTALGYLTLRYSSEWKNRYRHLAEYLAKLEERPSFVKTRPPES